MNSWKDPQRYAAPPERIDLADCSIRRWRPTDAPALLEAIAASRTDLMRWTPWVIPEPFAEPVLVERLTRFCNEFDAGQNFIYGIFDSSEERVLGGVGLYGRVGPGALEVGYWIRSDQSGRGLAGRAAAELTRAAFEHCQVERVELRCAVDHAASQAIARRLRFQFKEVLSLEDGGQLSVWAQNAPDQP